MKGARRAGVSRGSEVAGDRNGRPPPAPSSGVAQGGQSQPSAVSSTLSPPKNRSSITCALRGSKTASACSASSRATGSLVRSFETTSAVLRRQNLFRLGTQLLRIETSSADFCTNSNICDEPLERWRVNAPRLESFISEGLSRIEL